MSKTIPLITSLALLSIFDPALANKFETIGGGVTGLSQEKLQLLKQISLYSGGFLLLLSIMAMLTRNRFEGFVGYSSRGQARIAVKAAIFLACLGALFLAIGYF